MRGGRGRVLWCHGSERGGPHLDCLPQSLPVIWTGLGGQGHIGGFRVQALVPAWEIREVRRWDMAQVGEAGGDSLPFFSLRGGVAQGELACGFRVPVAGTAGVWGWEEEKQEGQDGPSVVHQVRSFSRKDLRILSFLIPPHSAPAFPKIPDKRYLLFVPCFFHL